MGVTVVGALEAPKVADQFFGKRRYTYIKDSNVQAMPIVGAGEMCLSNPIPQLYQFGISNGRTI